MCMGIMCMGNVCMGIIILRKILRKSTILRKIVRIKPFSEQILRISVILRIRIFVNRKQNVIVTFTILRKKF